MMEEVDGEGGVTCLTGFLTQKLPDRDSLLQKEEQTDFLLSELSSQIQLQSKHRFTNK